MTVPKDYSSSHFHQWSWNCLTTPLLAGTGCHQYLIFFSNLMGEKWLLIVLLICISTTAWEVEHLFICLLAICISAVNCLILFSTHLSFFFVLSFLYFFVCFLFFLSFLYFCYLLLGTFCMLALTLCLIYGSPLCQKGLSKLPGQNCTRWSHRNKCKFFFVSLQAWTARGWGRWGLLSARTGHQRTVSSVGGNSGISC